MARVTSTDKLIFIKERIVRDKRLNLTDTRCAIIVVDYDRGNGAWPGYDTIAEGANVPKAAAVRSMNKLHRLGIIRRERIPGKRSNRYFPDFEKGVSGDTPKGVSGDTPKGVSGDNEGCLWRDPKGVSGETVRVSLETPYLTTSSERTSEEDDLPGLGSRLRRSPAVEVAQPTVVASPPPLPELGTATHSMYGQVALVSQVYDSEVTVRAGGKQWRAHETLLSDVQWHDGMKRTG
jgi:hypothetical protein